MPWTLSDDDSTCCVILQNVGDPVPKAHPDIDWDTTSWQVLLSVIWQALCDHTLARLLSNRVRQVGVMIAAGPLNEIYTRAMMVSAGKTL